VTESRATVVTDPVRQRAIVFSIAFASFMVNLDTYIVNISLPTIAHSFQVGTDHVSWIVLSYALTISSTLLLFGRMGDIHGLRRFFLLGFGIFTVGSVLCGLSYSLFTLVASRIIQGIGGSILYALTPAMVPRYLPSNRQGAAYGITSTVAALGITLGTPLGGILTGLVSWKLIFLVNIPFGVMAIWIGRWVLPPDSPAADTKKRSSFDLAGTFLSAMASVLFIYALNQSHRLGFTSPVVSGFLCASLVLFLFFLIWERKIESPLLDLRLFRNRAFTYGNVAAGLAVAFLAGHNFLIPFYLELAKGLNTERAGLMILFYSVVYMMVSLAAGRTADRIDPRKLCITAMLGASLAAFSFSFFLDRAGLWPVIGYFVMMGISYAMFFSPNNKIIIGSAEPGTQGIVSGVLRLFTRIGMAVGVCLFETTFSFFRNHGDEIASSSSDSQGNLIIGFQYAYALGGALCVAAVIFTFLSASAKRRSAAVP